jgi:hypothetical protein
MSDGGPDQPDEDALRRAAEGGDAGSAVGLGCLLVDQERHEEGRSWLERALHSASGPEAAFHLGHSFHAQDRAEQAEASWLVAAHAGHLRAAMALAGLLEETERGEDARHWLRQVAGSDDVWLRRDAADRLAERRVADLARAHAARGDWPALWALVLAVPVTDAVTAAGHLRRTDWRPEGQRAGALAERLLAADGAAVARVADRAARLSTRILPQPLDFVGAGAAELVGDDPVLALSTYGRSAGGPDELSYRLSTLDVGGDPVELLSGPDLPWSFGLLDRRTVLTVRSSVSGSGRIRWELLVCTEGGAEQLASGDGAPYPRLVTTRDGFVVGLQLSSQVIVGAAGEMTLLDLAPAGIRYRTNILAVAPDRTSVAFAEGQVLVVVDTRSWNVVAAVRDADRADGEVDGLAFLSPDRLVSAGPAGMVLWAVEDGAVKPLATNDVGWVKDLFTVPAWGVVGGTVDGSPRFFDDAGLGHVATPGAVIGRGEGIVRRMCAAPGGRFVVYGGQFLVGEGNYDDVTAVHDLRHPLSWVHRAPAALSGPERAELAAVLDGSSPLADDERRVLELVRAAAEIRGR